jgi:DNA modification methylase
LVSKAVKVNDGRKTEIDNAFQRGETPRRNIHPTVKPTDLMQYLIRLIAPKGATVLDLFMGSGSTGKAAMIENVEREANYHFIGIDRTEEYLPIAQARIEFGRNYAEEKPKADGVVHKNQIDLFSLL